jgi:hypothetical protein
MRKFAIAAAGLVTAGLLAAGPVVADEFYDVCFDIDDQLYIEAGATSCEAVITATLPSGQSGVITVAADGILLCTALEGKWLAGVGGIAGEVMWPFPSMDFTLTKIDGLCP